MRGLTKKQVANFLLPRVGTIENAPSAAKFSCALLALYAGCGKKIIEAYYPLEEIIQMGYAELHGTRYVLSSLAKKHLDIERTSKSDWRVDEVIKTYRKLMLERAEIAWDPASGWTDTDFARAGKAAKQMLRSAAASPRLKGNLTEETVLEYVKKVLRSMIYSAGDDYYFYRSKGWDIWTLARSFNRYTFSMREMLPRPSKKQSPVDKPTSTGRTIL